MTSWREGGGRNLQPSSLILGLATDPEGKSPALGETGPPPASSHPSSTSGTTSCSAVTSHPPVPDPKEPPLRPAQPIRRTAVPTALQYQFHHTSTAVYHDMLPAFVSAASMIPPICCSAFLPAFCGISMCSVCRCAQRRRAKLPVAITSPPLSPPRRDSTANQCFGRIPSKPKL